MEMTEEELAEILNGVSIIPPRIEDAGLEDCALPSESITEAFSRAVKSRLIAGSAEDDGEEIGGCVRDPCPTMESCARDKVIVVGPADGELLGDRVVVLEDDDDEMGGKRSCVVDGDEGWRESLEVKREM